MRFCVLGSGSKGNCTYLEAGRTRVLIDAGFTAIEIERRLQGLGIAVDSLAAILITHEHRDHVRGVSVLSRRHRLPVLASPATLAAAGPLLGRIHGHAAFAAGTSFTFQDLLIHPFVVSHDAADPVGFLITSNGLAFGYCTDTGTVSRLIQHRLAGCDALVLESNHDPEMLQSGPYPVALKQRVRSKTGHLANHEAMALLNTLRHAGLRHVTLAHISETNNRPDLVLASVANLLGPEFVGVALARQDVPGDLIDLRGRVK